MTTSMTTPFTEDEIEAARKLFEGPWDFVWASTHIDDLPPMVGQEIAFAGRSNVGKSSLINAVTRRNALARTSHTPGRTQQLNFFRQVGADERLTIVDMPGYGYAAVGRAKVAAWTNLIQPFWALPALAIAGLKAKDVMGFCLIVLVVSGVVISAGLLWG